MLPELWVETETLSVTQIKRRNVSVLCVWEGRVVLPRAYSQSQLFKPLRNRNQTGPQMADTDVRGKQIFHIVLTPMIGTVVTQFF